MSDKYKITDKEKAYFVTLTIVGWIDVFTRKNHKLQIVEPARGRFRQLARVCNACEIKQQNKK